MEAIENVTVLPSFFLFDLLSRSDSCQTTNLLLRVVPVYLHNNVQNHDQHHGEKRGGKCVYPTGFHGSITAVTTAGVNSHRNGADCNLSYQRQLSDASGSEWVFLPSWKGTRV